MPEASTKAERKGGFGLIRGLQNAQLPDDDSEEGEWNGNAEAADRHKWGKAQTGAKEAAKARCWADEEDEDDIWGTDADELMEQNGGNSWVAAMVKEKTDNAIRQGKWNRTGTMENLGWRCTTDGPTGASGPQRKGAHKTVPQGYTQADAGTREDDDGTSDMDVQNDYRTFAEEETRSGHDDNGHAGRGRAEEQPAHSANAEPRSDVAVDARADITGTNEVRQAVSRQDSAMQQLHAKLALFETQQLQQRTEMQEKIQQQFKDSEARIAAVEGLLETLSEQGMNNSRALTQVTTDVSRINEWSCSYLRRVAHR